MSHKELIQLINNFKSRSQQSGNLNLMKDFQNVFSDQHRKTEALKLLQEGINIYQATDNFSESIKKIEESINLLPSAAGYFNKGVINWCEHNYFACFKDQCAALLLDTDSSYPLAYFYLAHSLYNVTGEADTSEVEDEKNILDFIIENLKEGKKRGDENASNMISHVVEHRGSLG